MSINPQWVVFDNVSQVQWNPTCKHPFGQCKIVLNTQGGVPYAGPAQQGQLGWTGPPQFLAKLNGGILKPTYEPTVYNTYPGTCMYLG